MVGFAIYGCAGVIALPFVEIYPAFVGPSFGRPLDAGGGVVLIEDGRIYVDNAEGATAQANARELTKVVKAPTRFVIQRWIKENPFTRPKAKQWLLQRLKAAGFANPKRIILRWEETRYDLSLKRRVGAPRVLDELELRL